MKHIYILTLIISSLLLQGCFEIVEQVTIEDSGSGTFQLTLNLSKSKSRVASILKMKTINGREVPSEAAIRSKIADVEQQLSAMKGIHNVTTKLDWQNYIATLTCQFENISSLNNAVKKIGQLENAPKASVEKNFDYNASTKTFSRLSTFSLKKDYQQLSNADKEVFNDAHYTGIYRFSSQVVRVSNTDSKVSPDKKAVMVKQNVLEVVTDKKTIQNTITLSK